MSEVRGGGLTWEFIMSRVFFFSLGVRTHEHCRNLSQYLIFHFEWLVTCDVLRHSVMGGGRMLYGGGGEKMQ